MKQPCGMEAIASRLETIALRLEAISKENLLAKAPSLGLRVESGA